MFKVLISIFLLSNIGLIQGQSQGCQICEAVIGEAKGLLQNNATEVQILNFLKTNVCGLLSGQLNQVCIQLIDQQGPGIINSLANDLNPEQICASLGLCKKFAQFKQQPPANCVTCKLLVGQIEAQLLNNQTESQIINTLENNLCPALGSLSATCKQLVEQYGPVIFQLLQSDISPEKVCELIGQCPKPPRKAFVQAPKPKAAPNCFTCELLVGQIENLVLNNQTETQIITTLETKLCPALGSLSATCKQLVEQFGPMIIEKLKSGISPEKVCELIGQCPKPPRKAFVQAPKPKAQNCVTCKLVVGQIENYILNNQTESQIINTLENNLCPALGSLSATCKQLVDQYGPVIFQVLSSGFTPEKVCELINQCPKPSGSINASKFSFLKGTPVDQHPIIQTKDIQPPLEDEEGNSE